MIGRLERSREASASVGAVASLLLGILVVAIIYKQVGIDDSVSIVALLLVPLVVYGLASGRLMELAGPGGVGIKFKETVSRSLGTSELLGPETLRLEPADIEEVAKGGLNQMQRRIEGSLSKGGPRALTMKITGGPRYSPGAVQAATARLSGSPNFK